MKQLVEFGLNRLKAIAHDAKLVAVEDQSIDYIVRQIEQAASTAVTFLESRLQIDELTQNRTIEEIKDMYYVMNESIRHNLSAKLMDTDEEHPMEVNITLEFAACGLSTLEMPTITSIYQDSVEGTMWIKFDDADDFISFDELHLEDKLQIVKDIE